MKSLSFALTFFAGAIGGAIWVWAFNSQGPSIDVQELNGSLSGLGKSIDRIHERIESVESKVLMSNRVSVSPPDLQSSMASQENLNAKFQEIESLLSQLLQERQSTSNFVSTDDELDRLLESHPETNVASLDSMISRWQQDPERASVEIGMLSVREAIQKLGAPSRLGTSSSQWIYEHGQWVLCLYVDFSIGRVSGSRLIRS